MKTTEFIVENSIIAQEADDMHRDHEVQMARSQLYSTAQAAIQIHRLLRDVSEMEGLEGWVQTKIAVASEYLESVRDYLKYESVSQEPEMMVFAEDAADYALDKLLTERSNKKMKEQTAGYTQSNDTGTTTYNAAGKATQHTTPSVGGFSQTKDLQTGRTTTTGQVGGVGVTRSTGGGVTDVTSGTVDLGPQTATVHSGVGFGGAGKDVQAPISGSITDKATGKTTNIVGRLPTQQDLGKDLSERKNARLKEMATGGASSAGAVATSMSGPASKKTSGVPKKVGNAYKSKKVEVGKGIY
jgi:hypothetical protein